MKLRPFVVAGLAHRPTLLSGKRLVFLAVLALAFAASLSLTLPGSGPPAQADHGAPHLDTLARAQFPDTVSGHFMLRLHGSHPMSVIHVNSASDIVVVKVTIPPGGFINWHTHPGPGTVAIAQGTLTLTYAHDCMARAYPAGQAFLDPGNMVHRADNKGSTEVVAYVTFLGIPPGPATIPAPTPPNC